MSLTLALNTALSSLNVNQRALSTLSQNIANANNPEYSRKVMNQEAVYIQGTGSGVRIRDIGRKVDEYLLKSVRNQGSDYAKAQTIADYGDRLQVLLGQPGSQNSIYSYATGFFNSLQNLAQTPENASLRVSAVNAAQTMTREFNTLANGIYDMQYSIDQEINQSITVVNRDLKQIHTLNATISTDKLLGRSTSELEDKRDTLVAEVASMVDIQTYMQSNGIMNIFTAGGFSLVDDSVYALSYNGVTSSEHFANGSATAAINVYRLDDSGNKTGVPNVITTAGAGSAVSTQFTSGKIKGLLDMRDRQLPDVLAKLDALASTMRDELNVVHNAGIAFPGANSYTGTRQVNAEDFSAWGGQVRIAVLDQDGKPVPSNYTDEESGMRPLLIDLSKLDTGNGEGNPSVQGIIDEINRYYGVPQNKVELGNINDMRLVLNNTTIPGSTPQLDFDFQLENISELGSDFYVKDIQILDDTDTDMTDITQNVPAVDLASTGTYVTTAGSATVTVNTGSAHGFVEGQRVYLEQPSGAIDGITAANLGGFFTVTNVTATSFDITVNQTASAGGSFDEANLDVRPSYYTAEAGTNGRSKAEGTIIANLATNTTSDYYTVKANVAVVDENGTISESTITYRIDNLSTNVKNARYAARSATGVGEVIAPNTINPAMRAKLVDENGVELPIINNQYTTAQRGYLQLVAGNSTYVIAIDSMDSTEGGKPNNSPAVEGTGRGFSHYFELNNIFVENRGDGVSDDIVGSARNMGLSTALSANMNLISLGGLNQSATPAGGTTLYTYERSIGDNSIVARLAEFNTNVVSFAAAGDMGATSLSLTSYAGQMISAVSAKTTGNQTTMNNSKLLLDGFSERSDSMRGVNLDEELANTIIYQNAYSASARIITVANQFFEALMDAAR